MRRRAQLLVSILVLGAFVIAAAFSRQIAPHNPYSQSLGARLIPPFSDAAYPLGTDYLGRDTLSRLLLATRYSLVVGLVATTVATILGVIIGVSGGYFGGAIDQISSTLITTRMAFPFVLLVLVLVVVLRPSLSTTIIALSITLWVRHAVATRNLAQSLRGREFVEAAVALGAGSARVLRRHLMPNLLRQILVLTSLAFSEALLAEAFLSFLGLGVQLPTPSLGNMIAESRVYALTNWWLAAFPGMVVFALAISVNTIGDVIGGQ